MGKNINFVLLKKLVKGILPNHNIDHKSGLVQYFISSFSSLDTHETICFSECAYMPIGPYDLKTPCLGHLGLQAFKLDEGLPGDVQAEKGSPHCSTVLCTELQCSALYYSAVHCNTMHCTVLQVLKSHNTIMYNKSQIVTN